MIRKVLKLSKVGVVWTNVEIIGAMEFVFRHYHTGLIHKPQNVYFHALLNYPLIYSLSDSFKPHYFDRIPIDTCTSYFKKLAVV